MGFMRDFFNSLWENQNVVNDESVNEELNQFLIENSESQKRVSHLEREASNDDSFKASKAVKKEELEKSAREAVKKYKANNGGSSNKVEKSMDDEEEEIEK